METSVGNPVDGSTGSNIVAGIQGRLHGLLACYTRRQNNRKIPKGAIKNRVFSIPAHFYTSPYILV